MSKKTKSQHYVPQFYLKSWSIKDTNQINVFDKLKNTKYISNIHNVACERYFYDIDPDEVFPSFIVDSLKENGLEFENEENVQFIEQAFSKEIEAPFSKLVNKIIDKTDKATHWHINNCYFINEDDKRELSFYLTLQKKKKKNVRNGIQDTIDCLTQAMKDMGIPESAIDKYNLSDEEVKQSHLKMMFDLKNLTTFTTYFYNYTWMLFVNRTKNNFFTSDHPIATQGHVYDSIMSTNGIASKGVEVIFPLSPKLLLVMVDGSYHTYCLSHERKYVEINSSEIIDKYNYLIVMQSDRFVFSADGNFDLTEKINVDILKAPKTQMTWGGKTYLPKN